MIEGVPPNTLFRRGFTYQASDGSMRANGRDVTLPDGHKLVLGSSGTGAPRDGRDPAER